MSSHLLTAIHSVPRLIVVGVLAMAMSHPSIAQITRIVAVSDSMTDTGNHFVQSGNAYPPSPPYWEGRSSNGPVWIEYLADSLGISRPAASRLGGTNAAFAGGTTGSGMYINPGPGPIRDMFIFPPIEVPRLGAQIDELLNQYTLGPSDLVVVWAGSVDRGIEIPGGPLTPEQIVTNLSQHITTLYEAGGRNFLVSNLRPLETEFNSLWTDQLAQLRQDLPIDIHFWDFSRTMQDIGSNPESFGFVPDFNRILGREVDNPDQYVLWDWVHLTTAAHRVLAQRAFDALDDVTGLYANRDLSGANFSNRNYTGAQFGYSLLTGANFDNADLTAASFAGSVVSDASFTDALVKGANFTAAEGLTFDQFSSTASYKNKDLHGISLGGIDLSGWNLAGQNLTGVHLDRSVLLGADLTGADISGASFWGTTQSGLTAEQISSTVSYQSKNLAGVDFGNNDFSRANFANQNLIRTKFDESSLQGATLDEANLEHAYMFRTDLTNASMKNAKLDSTNLGEAILTEADLAGADISGAMLADTTRTGLTGEQIYETASYQNHDLRGVVLRANDLTEWDFSDQNLSDADLSTATLTRVNLVNANLSNANLNGSEMTAADLTGAVVAATVLSRTTERGLTKEQLYKTANYQARDLRGIDLGFNDLTGWDLSHQNLSHADLSESALAGADLSGADLTGANLASTTLTGANLADAVITGASLSATTPLGLVEEQFRATQSYDARDLQGIDLSHNNLAGWDFHEQDLAGATFSESRLTDADLTASNLRAANLERAALTGADLAQSDLTGAVLTFARLVGTNLANADLSSAMLDNADLSRADLRGATGLTVATSTRTRSTVFPDGRIDGLDVRPGEVFPLRNHEALPITIHKKMQVAEGSTIAMEFDDDPWKSEMALNPDIPVDLGGTLKLSFVDDADPRSQVGRTFQLFQWNHELDPTNRFDSIEVSTSDVYWFLGHLYTTGSVSLRMLGDTDGNQRVDADDLTTVVTNWTGILDECTDPSLAPLGDFDGDCDVDAADLITVVVNWTGAAAVDKATYVLPEPSSLALCLLGWMFLLRTARSRHTARPIVRPTGTSGGPTSSRDVLFLRPLLGALCTLGGPTFLPIQH